MSARRDKTIEEKTIAADIGNEEANPTSIDGDGAGAISKSCDDQENFQNLEYCRSERERGRESVSLWRLNLKQKR